LERPGIVRVEVFRVSISTGRAPRPLVFFQGEALAGYNLPKWGGDFSQVRAPMLDDELEEYRKQAEYCRLRAAKVTNPLDKDAWLRAAEEWETLAREIEWRWRPRG
jgi:hypothetical protein